MSRALRVNTMNAAMKGGEKMAKKGMNTATGVVAGMMMAGAVGLLMSNGRRSVKKMVKRTANAVGSATDKIQAKVDAVKKMM